MLPLTATLTLVNVLLLILALICGIAVGVYFTRRGVAQQLKALRDEAAHEREEDRTRHQRANEAATDLLTASHENLLATISRASTEAVAALEKTHAETVRAQDDGASKLLASVREQLADADAERSKVMEAREVAERDLTTVNTRLSAALAQMAEFKALRDEAVHEREEDRTRHQRANEAATDLLTASHENLLATIGRASAEAVAALEKTHAETVRAHDDGASKLLVSVREQLADADAERSKVMEAREVAERDLTTVNTRLSAALAQMAELRDQFQADRTAIEERIRELVQAVTAKALMEANSVLLEQSSKQFIAHRAETIKSVEIATQPLTVGIQKFQQTVVEFDKAREAGAESLKATLETMARSDDTLRQTVERSTTETAKLSTALRDNRVRGRWGEIGLRNVLEKVGLTNFCDFVEQAGNEDGKRPDVVIRLPGDREVAIDSKVPFEAYMSALEATDPAEQQRLLLQNADVLKTKVRDLASKGYHRTPKAIGVTILYVQIESVVAAALSVHPTLVEEAIDLGIVIATPATLLAYLRAFSREWSLYKQSQNALQIVQQAHEMLDRLVTFAERFAVVGAKLDDSVKAWNMSVGSFDGRLVVTAKQIADLSATAFTIARPPLVIETSPREVQKVGELRAVAASIAAQDKATLQEALSA